MLLPLILFAALSGLAAAKTPVRLELTAPYPSLSFDVWGYLKARLSFSGPCPAGGPPLSPMPGTFTLYQDGVPFDSYSLSQPFYRVCVDGAYSGDKMVSLHARDLGSHTYTLAYSGDAELAPSVSNSVRVSVEPHAAFASPSSGGGTIRVGVATTGGWRCFDKQFALEHPRSIPPPPAGIRFPYGAVYLQLDGCYFECYFLCWPGIPTEPRHNVLVEYPDPLPASAALWELRGATWHRLDTGVAGRLATSSTQGAAGSGTIAGLLALGLTDTTPGVQDLWWAGEAENGWGLSVSQRGDRMFVVLYVYDGDGSPQWLVMPLGRWDAPRGSVRGDLYRPSGTWFGRYDSSKHSMGAPVGSARLTFAGAFSGSLEYTVDGRSGIKQIRRQVFAPSGSAVSGPYAGLWWGGETKSGWGLHIGHQDDTLFAVWYTYGADGEVAWYVMPGGAWTAAGRYAGTLYRTTGSPWVGDRYDPARLVVKPVGSMSLTFTGPEAGSMEYSVDGVAGKEAISPQPH